MTDLAESVLLAVMWSSIAVGCLYLGCMLAVLAAMWWLDR